jgi:AraC-like DNA-binding protein
MLTECGPKARNVAFQIDAEPKTTIHRALPPALMSEFFRQVEECAATGNHTEIAAYITMFCFSLWGKEQIAPKPINDYGILIHEFFAQNYNRDVYLDELAHCLHLSNRQTERLVLEHTGNTFRRELSLTRLNMARHLMQTTSLSMREIAHYVGYRSYAGFWKAMRADRPDPDSQ